MSREVPFDEAAKCDCCGKTGAFDFMGDLLCAECTEAIEQEETMLDCSIEPSKMRD